MAGHPEWKGDPSSYCVQENKCLHGICGFLPARVSTERSKTRCQRGKEMLQ